MARIVESNTERGSEDETAMVTELRGDETKIHRLIKEATLEPIASRC